MTWGRWGAPHFARGSSHAETVRGGTTIAQFIRAAMGWTVPHAHPVDREPMARSHLA